jgi:hypothetical protein
MKVQTSQNPDSLRARGSATPKSQTRHSPVKYWSGIIRIVSSRQPKNAEGFAIREIENSP